MEVAYVFQLIGKSCESCKLISDSDRIKMLADFPETLVDFSSDVKSFRSKGLLAHDGNQVAMSVLEGEIGAACDDCFALHKTSGFPWQLS
jgi:hypothetical protein